MLSKRYIIETINDQLKNIWYIEQSTHRSMKGFMLNLLAGLVAYCLKKDKPSLNLIDLIDFTDLTDLTGIKRNSVLLG